MNQDVPAASPPCPRCNGTTTECFEGISSRSIVDYFRCLGCGHVWNMPRAASEPPCDIPPAVGE